VLRLDVADPLKRLGDDRAARPASSEDGRHGKDLGEGTVGADRDWGRELPTLLGQQLINATQLLTTFQEKSISLLNGFPTILDSRIEGCNLSLGSLHDLGIVPLAMVAEDPKDVGEVDLSLDWTLTEDLNLGRLLLGHTPGHDDAERAEEL